MESIHTAPRHRPFGRTVTLTAALFLVLAGASGLGAAGLQDTTAVSSEAATPFQVAQADTAQESDELRRLIDQAGTGDRDAALALARHYVSHAAPDYETAAKYAMIALAGGGMKYAAAFVPNTRAWPREFWRMVQLELLTDGRYTSTLDGLPGPGTQRALWAHAGVKAPAATQRVRTLRNRSTTRTNSRKTRRGSYSN